MSDKIIHHKAFAGDEDRPDREEAEDAVRTLLRWIGEDPAREGLKETPARVVRAYEEFFKGYQASPEKELSKTFEDIQGFDDIILVKDIDFVSHCEHHIVPIVGKAHVAYWPDEKIVGISKLARIVDIYARRLISQENMTQQIMQSIDKTLKPKGVAVMIDANHQCMSIRGVNKANAGTVTSCFSGIFQDDLRAVERFHKMIER